MVAPRRAAGAFALVGAVVLASSTLVGWYSITVAPSALDVNSTSTVTIFLDGGAAVNYTCHPAGFCGGHTTGSSSDSLRGSGLNATAALYGAVETIMIGSTLLGAYGGVQWVAAGRLRGRGQEFATSALISALVLAASGPTVLYLTQPMALAADHYAIGGNASGPSPARSFVGNCSTSCGRTPSGLGAQSESWGPGLGWFLSIFGALFFGISLVVARFGRSEGALPAAGPRRSEADPPSIENEIE
jgi:hypothetical protein